MPEQVVAKTHHILYPTSPIRWCWNKTEVAKWDCKGERGNGNAYRQDVLCPNLLLESDLSKPSTCTVQGCTLLMIVFLLQAYSHQSVREVCLWQWPLEHDHGGSMLRKGKGDMQIGQQLRHPRVTILRVIVLLLIQAMGTRLAL